MKQFNEILESKAGLQKNALVKHFMACFGKIPEWEDFTSDQLNEFVDYLKGACSQSSARTYAAVLKALIHKYCNKPACQDYRSILMIRDERPMKIYLDTRELARLERINPHSETEETVLYQFLIAAYTGARISDCQKLSAANMTKRDLVYTSIKTSITSQIPMKPSVKEYILKLDGRQSPCMNVFNDKIRMMCARARINDKVTVFKAGKHITDFKWKFVSSHTARISFATNLSDLGMPIQDISKLMGHTSIATTMRYIVNKEVKMSDTVKQYFK